MAASGNGRVPVPRDGDDYTRDAAASLGGELSLGSAIVGGQWAEARDILGRNRS